MGDKRKAAAELDAAAAKKAAKRQKQKAAKLKQKRRRREVLKEDSRIVRACPADQQAAFFQHACFGSLSQLEREEFPLTAAHFQRVADADQPADPRRLALSLRPLVSANAGEAPTGSPRVICVCQGALRAVDVARGFATLQCGVAKLFAKHFKEAEQAEYLRSSRAKVAVGTPHRLHRLCAAGALKLDALQLLIIDTSTDVKGLTLFDQRDLRDSFVAWYRESLHGLVVGGQAKLCFF